MQTLTIYRQTQFQSTLPRGERLANAYETINRNRISIHAPTRGATLRAAFDLVRMVYFNPRSHEGSAALGLMANSGIKDFNPRSHEGSD